MKIFFTPYVIKEMQIQAAIQYNCTCTTIRMAKIQNTDNAKCYWGCGITTSSNSWTGMKNGTATLEDHVVVYY